jgi:hypothetical protein
MAVGTILAGWPGNRRRPTDPTSAGLAEDVTGPAPDLEPVTA